MATAYELMLLTGAELEESERASIIERAQKIVTDGGGSWDTVDDWGRRRLIYPIEKKEEAWYSLLYFNCDGPTLDEVRRVLRITEGVVRFMAVHRVPPVPQDFIEHVAASAQADAERRERSRSRRGSSR